MEVFITLYSWLIVPETLFPNICVRYSIEYELIHSRIPRICFPSRFISRLLRRAFSSYLDHLSLFESWPAPLGHELTRQALVGVIGGWQIETQHSRKSYSWWTVILSRGGEWEIYAWAQLNRIVIHGYISSKVWVRNRKKTSSSFMDVSHFNLGT